MNETGIEEAKKLRDKLSDVHFDIIYCSPLKRAKQTAEIINENRNIPIILDPRLMEQYYGDLERKPREGDEYTSHRESAAKRYPHGESYFDVAARIYPFLNELRKCESDKDILLVCHGGISRVINSYFTSMENDEFFHFGMENCGLIKYEFPELPDPEYFEKFGD